MCISPLKILNNCSHFDERKPFFLRVPCGHCVECNRQQSNDWFLRSYYEYKNCAQAFFYTLTYNNENLPRIFGYPCFNSRHIQLFLKKIRKQLKRDFDISLRFFQVCEYGELRHRPHYHIIFFLDKTISPIIFYKVVEKNWQYGFVEYGDNIGQIYNDRALFYVTKYVCKDYAFVESSFFNDILIRIQKRFLSLYNYYKSRYRLRHLFDLDVLFHFTRFDVIFDDFENFDDDKKFLLSSFRRKYRSWFSWSLPFHRQSLHFGMQFIDNPSFDEVNEKVSLYLSDNKIKIFNLPRYYRRLLWYDVVESSTTGKKTNFVLNTEGIRHYKERLSAFVESAPHPDIFSDSSVFEALPAESVLKIHAYNKHLHTFFGSKNELKEFLVTCRYTYTKKSLNIYRYIYRNRCCFSFHSFKDVPLNFFLDSWQDVMDFQLEGVVDYDFGRLRDSLPLLDLWRKDFDIDFGLFNCCDCFVGMELYLQVLEALDDYIRTDVSIEKDSILRRYRVVKNIINPNY